MAGAAESASGRPAAGLSVEGTYETKTGVFKIDKLEYRKDGSDLTGSFTSHGAYVLQVAAFARDLQARGYLLEADADAIVRRAVESNIGRP